jgi:hypothetical protein
MRRSGAVERSGSARRRPWPMSAAMWKVLGEVFACREFSPQHFGWSFVAGAAVALVGLFSMGLLGAGVYCGWQWLLQHLHLDLLPDLQGDRVWPGMILASMALGGVYPLLHGCNLLLRLPTAANVALVIAWTLVSAFAARLVK